MHPILERQISLCTDQLLCHNACLVTCHRLHAHVQPSLLLLASWGGALLCYFARISFHSLPLSPHSCCSLMHQGRAVAGTLPTSKHASNAMLCLPWQDWPPLPAPSPAPPCQISSEGTSSWRLCPATPPSLFVCAIASSLVNQQTTSVSAVFACLLA